VLNFFKDRPDDLLVMNQMGWPELCSFLGEPIPDVPYPRLWITPKPSPRIQDVTVAELEKEPPPDDDTVYCGSATENAADVIRSLEARTPLVSPAEPSRSIQPETVSLTLAPSDVGSLSADPSPVATDREPKESVKDGYRPTVTEINKLIEDLRAGKISVNEARARVGLGPLPDMPNVRAADKPVEKPEQNWLQRLWAFLCWLFAVIVRLFSKAK
jgi:hypothetical protein